MKDKERKKIRKEYAAYLYVDHALNYYVGSMESFPDYIEEETLLDYSAPFLKKMVKNGLLIVREEAVTAGAAGEQLVAAHPDYAEFFRLACPYILIDDYVELRDSLPGTPDFYTVMVQLLESRRAEKFALGEFQAARDIAVDLAGMLAETEPERAAKLTLEALLIIASGTEHVYMVEECTAGRIRGKDLGDMFGDYFYPDLRVKKALMLLKEYCTPQAAQEVYRQCALSFNLCSPELFLEIVAGITAGTPAYPDWQDKLFAEFEKRYRKLLGRKQKVDIDETLLDSRISEGDGESDDDEDEGDF